MEACVCDIGLSNTGSKNCPIASVAILQILVPLKDSAGVDNAITIATDILDTAFWEGKINAEKKADRWFFLPKYKNVADVRAESIKQTFDDQSNLLVAKGVRTLTAMFPKQSAVFYGKLEDARCVKMGTYFVDKDGSLIGKISKDGTKLLPIKIDNETWDPILTKATDTTVQMVQLNFEFAIAENDRNIRIITDANIDFELLDAEGLLDVQGVNQDNISTLGFDVALVLEYGDVKTPIKVLGFLIGDFELFNETDQLAIVITSVTEGPDGTYVFVTPAQTSADVLTLSSKIAANEIVKKGFEIDPVTITIP